jgi:hypothetical protein
MKANLIRYSILFALFLGLSSWGEKAHRKINTSCVDFFPKELSHLKGWSSFLGDHGSDADNRKRTDKTEFVKHFIDIDLYPDFLSTHQIPEDFSTLCTKYGKAKIIKDGTLPWVTDSTYKALVQNFKAKNWEQAKITASDLGHYVGDGFMPLHISGNYNGQLSDQTGIHSRYEGTMINKYIDQISFITSGIKKVTDIQSTIFRYLYSNHSYVGLLLQADHRAFEQAGKQYNGTYYENLWGTTNWFTIRLLQESSKTLASFIYTAWIEAGRPKIPENL